MFEGFGGGLTLGGMKNGGIRAPGGITIPVGGCWTIPLGSVLDFFCLSIVMGILTILGVVFCATGCVLLRWGHLCVPLSETLSAPYRCQNYVVVIFLQHFLHVEGYRNDFMQIAIIFDLSGKEIA